MRWMVGAIALVLASCGTSTYADVDLSQFSRATPDDSLFDPRICNRDSAGSDSIAYQVGDGPGVRASLPNMLRAPELDGIRHPMTVVVFLGPHASPPGFHTGLRGDGEAADLPSVLENVVCVVDAAGQPNWYGGVDSRGLTLPKDGVEWWDG